MTQLRSATDCVMNQPTCRSLHRRQLSVGKALAGTNKHSQGLCGKVLRVGDLVFSLPISSLGDAH